MDTQKKFLRKYFTKEGEETELEDELNMLKRKNIEKDYEIKINNLKIEYLELEIKNKLKQMEW